MQPAFIRVTDGTNGKRVVPRKYTQIPHRLQDAAMRAGWRASRRVHTAFAAGSPVELRRLAVEAVLLERRLHEAYWKSLPYSR